MRVLLLSTYDLGRSPFGLASPAAWLRANGHQVRCADLAVEPLPENALAEADLVGFSLPMHTATRLALPLIAQTRATNPGALLVAFGLYAPLNEAHLREQGVHTVLGAEFEADLLRLADGDSAAEFLLSLGRETARLAFRVPDRSVLPVLDRYAHLRIGPERRRVGATEASRGCKHLCRHCPVVPVYQGQFRVVPVDVVLADVRQQVAAGAEHITFGDPDFLNGPTHAVRLVRALHAEFPRLTYDATIKVEHLLRHRDLLPLLRDTGCLFVTSAVESLQDDVLELLDKGHTRADFLEVVETFRHAGLTLSPTFIAFTPWTTRESYREMLRTLRALDLEEHVSPVQLALRLLITNDSRLLELPDVQAVVRGYDAGALLHRWEHPDPRVDALAAEALRTVHRGQREGLGRSSIFARLMALAEGEPIREQPILPSRATVPYLDEPWYC